MKRSKVPGMKTKSRNALMLTPTPKPNASEAVVRGLYYRNQANMTGKCDACGAVAVVKEQLEDGSLVEVPGVRTMRDVSGDVAGRMLHQFFQHEDDCPVIDPELQAAAKRGEINDPAGDLLLSLAESPADRMRRFIDEKRFQYMEEHDGEELPVVIIDQGKRGPNIFDTRGHPPGEWVWEEILPTGVICAVADLDDPSPEELLEQGFDVVHHLACSDPVAVGDEVVFTVHFHPRLGLTPPAPIRTRFTGTEWKAVD